MINTFRSFLGYIPGATDDTKIGNVGDRLKVDGLVANKGVDLSALLNVGFGASITCPAFPAIKPLGFYVVPAGKKLRLFGVMYKTQNPTSYLHIYQRKVLWSFGAVAIAAPAAPTLTAKTILGSGLTTGTYRVKVVAVNSIGKSIGSAETSITLSGSQNAITSAWTAVAGTLYYEVYRTAVGGLTGTQKFLATTDGLSFTDVSPDSALGTGTPPIANTTSGSFDGYVYPTNYAASTAMIDTVTAITTPTVLDVVYKNIYGDLRYTTVTPGAAAGAQVEIPIGGKNDCADDRRVPRAGSSGQYIDVAISDIVSLGNLPATGSLSLYGVCHFFMVAGYIANQWNTDYFDVSMTIPAGEEISFGVSGNASNAIAARNDVILLGTLE